MPATDTDLVAAALRGDQSGIAAIYDRYADRLHNYAWSVCRSHADASDVLQDTFVTASQRLGQLRDPERLRPWLYAVARFAGPLPTRVFQTGTVPVTVVLDTNDISETLATTTHHDHTELTDELRQLAVSDSALRAPAHRATGYAITVQLQGFLTGGIVIEWVTTVSEPGRQQSAVFSSPDGDCDVSINFTVVEID